MRRYSAHLGYLFTELPLEDRFGAAARAGFSFVEHSSPYALRAEHVRDLCRDNGLTFLQMALPAGDAARGDKGLAGIPGREAEFLDTVDFGLRYAQVAGAQYVHVMAGVLPGGAEWTGVRPTYVANLRHACEAGRRQGAAVIVEAIGPGTVAGYVLDDPTLAVDAFGDIGAENLSLLLDAFHEANAGRDPTAFFGVITTSFRMSISPTIPGATSPAPDRWTFAACSRFSTRSATRVRSGWSTFPRRAPCPVWLGGTAFRAVSRDGDPKAARVLHRDGRRSAWHRPRNEEMITSIDRGFTNVKTPGINATEPVRASVTRTERRTP